MSDPAFFVVSNTEAPYRICFTLDDAKAVDGATYIDAFAKNGEPHPARSWKCINGDWTQDF